MLRTCQYDPGCNHLLIITTTRIETSFSNRKMSVSLRMKLSSIILHGTMLPEDWSAIHIYQDIMMLNIFLYHQNNWQKEWLDPRRLSQQPQTCRPQSIVQPTRSWRQSRRSMLAITRISYHGAKSTYHPQQST